MAQQGGPGANAAWEGPPGCHISQLEEEMRKLQATVQELQKRFG